MTSIIGIRCGGFDQCSPTTREGSEQTSAIFVIGMPEVFDERMAPGAASCSSCGNSSCLSSRRSGIDAVQFVGAQPNDGYTLLVGSPSPFSVLPALRNDLPYNNLQDFVPVTLFGVAPEALTVNPGLPVKTLPELIAYLKSSPAKVNFGNTGPGGLPHLSSELFAQLSDTKINHVPYRGTAPSVADVISGHIQGNRCIDKPTGCHQAGSIAGPRYNSQAALTRPSGHSDDR